MMSHNKLKPCPFCGSTNVGIYMPYCGKEKPFITCYDCLADGPAKRDSEDFLWNTRPTEKALLAKIMWLRDGFKEMASWNEGEAAERCRQYAKDCLSGWDSEQKRKYMEKINEQ